jgi:hypothetical protein
MASIVVLPNQAISIIVRRNAQWPQRFLLRRRLETNPQVPEETLAPNVEVQNDLPWQETYPPTGYLTTYTVSAESRKPDESRWRTSQERAEERKPDSFVVRYNDAGSGDNDFNDLVVTFTLSPPGIA